MARYSRFPIRFFTIIKFKENATKNQLKEASLCLKTQKTAAIKSNSI